ncbi:GNAT family N-acetyltransferase [Amycolatopsis benzoatilytica]|uniref:GNAT family N-acetyltransferase n=1 Tax=Amycolatopsis benzoatilytica TaxID=346045 RepID=UPI00247FC52D|nr:GNAT family N-acetyltransferase [Amycolatopsis benzoatilytica]
MRCVSTASKRVSARSSLPGPARFPLEQRRSCGRGCAAPEINRCFPDCPELNGLGVWPPERRSHGIGTAILRAAEAHVQRRGYRRIGLGVDDANHRAGALYLRLGYQETGCHYLDRYHYIDEHGTRHEVADPARFLIKQLPAAPTRRGGSSRVSAS